MAGLHTAKQYAAKQTARPNVVQPVKTSAPEARQPLILWTLMHPEVPAQGSALSMTMNIDINGEPFILAVKDGTVRTYHEKLANWLTGHGYLLLSKDLI